MKLSSTRLKSDAASDRQGYSFKCNKCSYVAKRDSHLTLHLKFKHAVKEKNKSLALEDKTCPQCSKMFCKRSNLERHIKYIHRITEGFDCDVCKLNLPSKEILDSHKKTHAVERKDDVNTKEYKKAKEAKEKDCEVKCFTVRNL